MTTHKGKPIIEITPKGVLILCPLRHYYAFVPNKEWPGSRMQSKVSDPAFLISCDRTIRKVEEEK